MQDLNAVKARIKELEQGIPMFEKQEIFPWQIYALTSGLFLLGLIIGIFIGGTLICKT